jgi:hypothetical protein
MISNGDILELGGLPQEWHYYILFFRKVGTLEKVIVDASA